jgi:regulator of replication initiation timing
MSIIDTAKDIYSLAAKGLTMDLQEKLMQLREQALELQEENLSLRGELLTLRQQLDREKNLEFDGAVYRDEKGTYCPTCHDKDDKLIRLQINKNPSIDARWCCNACGAFF